jgi:hypothetical protein
LHESVRQFGDACNNMAEQSRNAARAINSFVETHHDMMNAAASAKALQSMGRPDLAMNLDHAYAGPLLIDRNGRYECWNCNKAFAYQTAPQSLRCSCKPDVLQVNVPSGKPDQSP